MIYLLILPTFGSGIDFQESFFFYFLPCLFLLDLLFRKTKPAQYLTPIGLVTQIILIILFAVSTVFSINVGRSFYAFFNFLTVILIFNLFSLYQSDRRLPYLLRFSVIAAGLYSFIFFLNKIGFIPLSVKPLGDNFILQVWGHSNLSNFLVFPLIYLFHRINSQNYRRNLPLFLFLIIALLLTLSRTSILAFLIGIFVLRPTGSIQPLIKKILILACSLSLVVLFLQKNTFGFRPTYWAQGLIGFSRSPLLGSGPSTFNVINRQLLRTGQTGSSSAHNSFLDFLSDNGLIFTLILYSAIFSALIYQARHRNLIFSLGLAGFVSSMFDPSWSFPGILVINLIIIFSGFSKMFTVHSRPGTKPFLFLLASIIFVFFVVKTISDFLYLNQKYELSLKFDPFNLNSRLADINQNPALTLKLFPNEPLVYEKLILAVPLPQSEPYYLKLSRFEPLAEYYLHNHLFFKFEKLNPDTLPVELNQKISIALRQEGVRQWSADRSLSLKYLQLALRYNHNSGSNHIELANAYWHLGRRDQAIFQLADICQSFPDPKTECSNYLSFLKTGAAPLAPGKYETSH